MLLDLRSYDQEALCHQHDYHQLVLPVSGALELDIAGQGDQIGDRKAAIIAAGSEHGCISDRDNCFVVADLPATLAPELARLPKFIELDPALAQYVGFLHEQIQRRTSDDASTAGSSEKQMLLLLIQLLQERYGQALRLDKRIQAARSYLDEHYAATISLSALAAIASLSPRQLSKLFREQLGMTPAQYQLEKRMQQSWQLLESTSLPIQQIADQVGYESLAAFSDRFRKHFGRSPRYFR